MYTIDIEYLAHEQQPNVAQSAMQCSDCAYRTGCMSKADGMHTRTSLGHWPASYI